MSEGKVIAILIVSVAVVLSVGLGAWAFTQSSRVYYAGIDQTGRPWCESRVKEKPCPNYSTEYRIVEAKP